MYELPEPVSKSALHLTPFTFIIATGYVTLVSVITNIDSDLLSSHINVWCLFLYFKQVLELRHSAALCLAPVQLKQSFLSLNIFLRSVTVFAVLQLEDLWLGFSQYTNSLFVQPGNFHYSHYRFLNFVNHSMVQDFLQSTSLKLLLIAEISSPASCHHFSQDLLEYPAVYLV